MVRSGIFAGFAIVVGVAWTSIALQGCGGGTTTSTTTSTTSSPTTAPTHAPTSAPTPTTAPTSPPTVSPTPSSPTTSPTPAPPTAPPTPTPTPAPPTPAPTMLPGTVPYSPIPDPPFCNDAACCKGTTKNPHDAQLCDDHYSGLGIAYTMVPNEAWTLTAHGSIDNAVFSQSPPTKRLDNGQEAMTLGNAHKGFLPYAAWSQYGFIFGLGQNTNFWKYFQQSTSTHTICGQDHDGFACCPACRDPILDWNYDQFKNAVAPIIASTGGNSHNEFDTNGLSGPDLYGVMRDTLSDKTWKKDRPSDATMCKFLAHAYPARTAPWPIWGYTVVMGKYASSISVERYLDCAGREWDVVNASSAEEVFV